MRYVVLKTHDSSSGFQGDPSGMNVEELREQVETADKLFQKGIRLHFLFEKRYSHNCLPVMGPSEATLDSHFLLMASNMGAQKARAMKSGVGSFDVDEFIVKLRNFMSGGLKTDAVPVGADEDESEYHVEASKLDWDCIGRLAMAKSRRAPALTFMCVIYSSGISACHSQVIQGWDLYLLNRRLGLQTSGQGNRKKILRKRNRPTLRRMTLRLQSMRPLRTFLW